MSKEDLVSLKIVAQVLPFKVNEYVINNLIDWANYKTDPIFRITFPVKEMLNTQDYTLIKQNLTDKKKLPILINSIRQNLNPDASNQSFYIPFDNNKILNGIQHKYKSTILIFPKKSQSCHSYCTFCFRWPQFVKGAEIKHQLDNIDYVLGYLEKNQFITDVILTGGDPAMLNLSNLKKIINPIISGKNGVKNIRIGTKSLTYYPNKFIDDKETNCLLKYYREIISKGYSLNIMIHLNHLNEMKPVQFKTAINNIKSTGCIIRSQSPILKGINNDFESWSALITEQIKLGIIPYYMFIPRETGANKYFSLNIIDALSIYKKIMTEHSGLSKTLRGPVMSTEYGKIQIIGIEKINGKDSIILKFIQSVNHSNNERIFFAKKTNDAKWISDLKPLNSSKFHFQ